MDFYFY